MHVVSCACPSPRMAAYQHQTELFCITAKGALDFRCGSDLLCRKRATSGREQSQQGSLIRSPRRPAPAALSDTVRSSGFAVLRLIASSNLLGRWSLVLIDHTCLGQSGGLAPISLPLFQGIRIGVGRIAC